VTVIVQYLTVAGAGKLVYDTVNQKGINVDLLVNNAGFGDYGAFSQQDLARQLEMIQLNNLVLVELTHYFLRPMLAGAGGQLSMLLPLLGFNRCPIFPSMRRQKPLSSALASLSGQKIKTKALKSSLFAPVRRNRIFLRWPDFPGLLWAKTAG